MKQDHKRERDSYIIEKGDGRKYINFQKFAFIYEDFLLDEDLEDVREEYPTAVINDDTLFVRTEMMHYLCEIPVSEYSKERLDFEMGEIWHELYFAPLECADDFPGKYLPLKDVTEDTSCGDYWCYLEDE